MAVWDNVVLAMHLDGANDGTTFTDIKGKTVTRGGGVVTKTAIKKGGTASAYFAGTSGNYLRLNGEADFAFGTGDFSIRAWFYITAMSGFIYDGRPNGGSGAYPTIYVDSSGTLRFHTNSATRITSGALSLNTWTHVEVSRVSGITRMFINGVKAGADYTDATNYINPAFRPLLGASGDTDGTIAIPGYIDELVVIKGAGGHSANFTPSDAFQEGSAFDSWLIEPAGIDSAGALGAATLFYPQDVSPAGIDSAGALGAATLFYPQDVSPAGIDSAGALGALALFEIKTIVFSGIGSDEVLGGLLVQPRLSVEPAGIPSAGALGALLVRELLRVFAGGIAGAEVVGIPILQRAGLGLAPPEASAWSVVVILGGEDVSGRIIGDLVIEAEEGAARLAYFAQAIAPTTPIVLSAFTGRSVTIDYTDGGAPVRLFTGVVELPAYDYTRRTITFRCTDDLPGVVAGMSRAAIDAVLLGSHYSSAVFAPTVDQWQYARDRSSTLAGSFDLSPAGALRYTSWVAASSGDYEFTAARLLDGAGPEVALANRSAIKNRISIAFDFRFPRCKRRAVSIGGAIGGSDVALWADFLTAGRWLLPRDTVREALSGDGWVVRGGAAGISFTAAPPTGVYNDALGNATVWNNAAPESICLGFSATLTRCYAQWIDERYTLVVENAASVATLGELPEAERHAMEAAFDVAAWETAANAQPTGGDFAGDHAEPTLPDAAAGEISVDYFADPERNRAAAETAVSTLVAAAQARIHAAHRQNGVSFSVPIVPALDTSHTVGVSASGLMARGKVRAVSHRMSLDSGEASTTVDLAICALQGLGLPSPVSPAIAPPPPAAAAINPSAVLSCTWTYANLPADDHQFVVTFPAIDADSRDHYAPAVTQTYSARLVEDLFEVTA